MNSINKKKFNSEFSEDQGQTEKNEKTVQDEENINSKNSQTIFEKWVDKFKEFLDNA